jgi:hypothetical protein
MTISRRGFLATLAGMVAIAVAGDLTTTEAQAKTKKPGRSKKGTRQTPPTSQAPPPKLPEPSGY